MATSVSARPATLFTVIVYGTSCPRVTFMSGVVLVIATAPLSSGSSGMWLLNTWLEPGGCVASNRRCAWYRVPALRAGTATPGANSDGCASQYVAVPGTASSALNGHDGT